MEKSEIFWISFVGAATLIGYFFGSLLTKKYGFAEVGVLWAVLTLLMLIAMCLVRLVHKE